MSAAAPLRPAQAETLSDATAFVQALRDNGCAMSGEEAGALLGPKGFTPEATRQFARILLDQDLATLEDEGMTIRLQPGLCAADPPGDGAIFGDLLTDDPDPELTRITEFGEAGVRATIWLHLRETGCAVDIADRDAALARLTETVALAAGFAQEMSEPARAALTGLVGTFLDTPGDGYAVEGTRLVAKDCTP